MPIVSRNVLPVLVGIQLLLLCLLLVTLTGLRNDRNATDSSQLEMLGNLALPYLISGDREGLRQSLDLVIQGTPVLEASILDTENRRQIQVINRSTAGVDEAGVSEQVRELVLNQTLLGTLSLSLHTPRPGLPWISMGIAAMNLILAILIGWLIYHRPPPGPPEEPSSAPRQRLLLGVTFAPLVPLLRSQANHAGTRARWRRIINQLAPNYGLDYLSMNEDFLLLVSRSKDAQGLRQAVAFAWNLCNALGDEQGLSIAAAVLEVELPDGPLASHMELIRADYLSQCEDLLTHAGRGSVVINPGLASLLPRDWSHQGGAPGQQSVVNELPASLCKLWRQQLRQLESTP